MIKQSYNKHERSFLHVLHVAIVGPLCFCFFVIWTSFCRGQLLKPHTKLSGTVKFHLIGGLLTCKLSSTFNGRSDVVD